MRRPVDVVAVPPPKTGGLPGFLRNAVAALGDTAIPITGAPRAPGAVAVERLDQQLAELPFFIRMAVLLGIWAIEWSGLLFFGRRFSRLPPEKRLRLLDRWHHGGAGPRLALRGILVPVKVAWFAQDEVAAKFGYRPAAFTPRPDTLDDLPPGDIRMGDQRRQPEELQCDVVVIGSGAGGAVVARELAAKGRKVVIIEEGHYWTRRHFTRRPLDMQRLLYRDQAFTVALGRGGIPIPLGMTVGGTTTVNSGTCFRVPEHTLERWRRDHLLPELNSELLAPFYDRVERNIGVRDVPDAVLGMSAQKVMLGAKSLGLHPQPLRRNAIDCKGSGVCCFGCPEDAKRSMNVSYIPAALKDGAILYTGTRAVDLTFDGQRATGVVCELGEARLPLHVRADAVVVAAGAIHTPVFLLKHGLGKRSGVLGKNLSIHPATKVSAVFDEEIRPFEGVPQSLYIHDLAEEGIMFEGIGMTPDFTSVGLPFYGPKLLEAMQSYLHLASFGLMVEDESKGQVKRAPDGRPLMLYTVGEAEIARLQKGIEIICRIFFRAGARKVYPPVGPIAELTDERECDQLRGLKLVPEDLELTAFHPLGTCRIGVNAERGMLDPDLETWERDRLFVVDGSVFPSSLGVNPQLTIMAFATRAAEHIDRRLSGTKRQYRTA